MAVLVFTSCVNAHVNYGTSSVKTVLGSRFASETVAVERISDARSDDRKSVSYHARKTGVYNKGVHFDPARQTDYRDVFKGIAYDPDSSYYIAPDRLYWKPDGPLSELRERLALHLEQSGVFRAAFADGSPARYKLELTANRFLSLKRRHPLADGIGFLGISALFSGDEIQVVDFDWKLTDVKSGKAVASGVVKFRDVEVHNNFRAKNRPFKLNNDAACRLGNELAAQLSASR